MNGNKGRWGVGIRAALFVLCWAGISGAAPGKAAERHELYYYPEISSQETYTSRARIVDQADRRKRIGFVVAHTLQQERQHYPPRYALFAKGEEADKLIIVGLENQAFRTLYRARAVMAQLTAIARSSELFREFGVADSFTFFDLVRMLGFRQITITNGEDFAHRVNLE